MKNNLILPEHQETKDQMCVVTICRIQNLFLYIHLITQKIVIYSSMN